jgi:monooxygenase
MTSEHFDGIVVGSGLSGVDAAAYHLQTATKSFLLREARDAIAGRWGLFGYPGIRSD